MTHPQCNRQSLSLGQGELVSDVSYAEPAAQPTVSVLVPIYNVEKYLAKCLDSLVSQTYDDFEAICINDGSTDGSRQIIQRYLDADPRFRVIDKANSGYGASMNRGLDSARGKYVAILESDDFFEPDALEKLVTTAEANGADVVKANFWLYWSRPAERKELFRVVDSIEGGKTLCPLDDQAIFFRKPSIWSALYTREFLAENGIRFLETPGASYQDAGFNFKVWAAARRASFIEEPVLFYRQDNEASSVNSAAKVFCVCDEYASMAAYVDERCQPDHARLHRILERMKFDSYLWNYDRLAPALRGDFVRCASKELARDLASYGLDDAYFEPGAKAGFVMWANNPERFVAARECLAAGRLGRVRHYLKLGGPALLARVLLTRGKQIPARRNDARGACS